MITSVDRDDLPDGGAFQFARCIRAIRASAPATTIQVLTPDFLRKPGAFEKVVDAGPDVYNHNLETVPRLYRAVRPGARYFHSLRLLDRVKAQSRHVHQVRYHGRARRGEAEIYQVMDDMRSAGVDFITIGQYLQPTPRHTRSRADPCRLVSRGVRAHGAGQGFLMVAASPLTRSSYHAGDDFARRARRAAALATAAE